MNFRNRLLYRILFTWRIDHNSEGYSVIHFKIILLTERYNSYSEDYSLYEEIIIEKIINLTKVVYTGRKKLYSEDYSLYFIHFTTIPLPDEKTVGSEYPSKPSGQIIHITTIHFRLFTFPQFSCLTIKRLRGMPLNPLTPSTPSTPSTASTPSTP